MLQKISSLSGFQRIVILLVVLITAVIAINAGQAKPLPRNIDSADVAKTDQMPETDTDLEATPTIAAVQGQETENSAAEVSDRLARVFVDSNSNKSFDSDEEGCNTCVAKRMILANSSGRLPALQSLVTTGIGAEGTFAEADLDGHNTAWAYYPDRKILVRPQLVSAGDGSGDINVAATPISFSFTAENANVVKIEQLATGNLQLIFTQLVPSMLNAANDGRQVWVQAIPDLAQPDYYYLGTGVLVKNPEAAGSPDGYILQVDFNTRQDLGGLESSQVNLFLL